MIKVSEVSKTYEVYHKKSIFSKKSVQYVKAVKNLSFEVKDGEKIGIIGLNGAGKSTTIKMMTGILTPDSGEISIMGYNPSKREKNFRKSIGVLMGQRSGLFFDLPLEESFLYYKEVYDISDDDYRERIKIWDEALEISKLLNIPVRKMSFGQRMKSELVSGLLHNPSTVFLDEPTVGLDVVSKEAIFKALDVMQKKYGWTIFLTTHELEHIEAFCKRIIVLKEGELFYDGEVKNFFSLGNYRKVSISREVYNDNPFDFEVEEENNGRVSFTISLKDNQAITNLKEYPIEELNIEPLTLQDVLKKRG